jgi:uncharacterized protein YggT (Ycf19 family)
MAEQTETHARGRVIGIVAAVLRWVGTIIAVILVAHVLLTVFGANPDNPITTFVRSWADPLALAFRDLFTPADGKLRVLANYGLAAIFWLIVTSIVVRLVRRLG